MSLDESDWERMYGKTPTVYGETKMTFSAQELITLTNQKQKMGMKETSVEKNQRIEVLIGALSYLVMKKVDLEGMKVLMKDLYEVIENS